MSLDKQYWVAATYASAKYFENEPVAKAIENAANSRTCIQEISRLNTVIEHANWLLMERAQGAPVDPDLRSMYDERLPFNSFPQVFGWKSRNERVQWTQQLLTTFTAIGSDIGPFYPDPTNKPSMSQEDIFRWFLLDGYSRWIAGLYTEQHPELINEERTRADIVVFALCEAAVVAAEHNEPGMREHVQWMLQNSWINTGDGYNLTPELVNRAKAVVGNEATTV